MKKIVKYKSFAICFFSPSYNFNSNGVLITWKIKIFRLKTLLELLFTNIMVSYLDRIVKDYINR